MGGCVKINVMNDGNLLKYFGAFFLLRFAFASAAA
jgi:hypothetical protein